MLSELKPLIGACAQLVSRNEFSWSIQFDRSFCLMIECHWRLLKNGSIVVTDEDHGQLFGLKTPVDAERQLQDAILGRDVTHCSFLGGTADLEIQFGGEFRLQAISNSSGHEAWQLSGPDNLLVVAQGGGCVAQWAHDER